MKAATRLDLAKLREELREFNDRLIAEGWPLPYRQGDGVAFTTPDKKNESGKAA